MVFIHFLEGLSPTIAGSHNLDRLNMWAFAFWSWWQRKMMTKTWDCEGINCKQLANWHESWQNANLPWKTVQKLLWKNMCGFNVPQAIQDCRAATNVSLPFSLSLMLSSNYVCMLKKPRLGQKMGHVILCVVMAAWFCMQASAAKNSFAFRDGFLIGFKRREWP